jgi:hypothetical protein
VPYTLTLPGFYFWMVVGQQSMGVDNASVNAMDFSSLPSNVAMIQWREGRGEIEYTTGPALHTLFTDVTPYCALFQQFMTLLSGLTMAQAQQIQIELCYLLYNNKRQTPINYTVSSGNYNWSSSDPDVAGMSAAIIASNGPLSWSVQIIDQVNAMIGQLNETMMSAGNFQVGTDGETASAASPGLATPLPDIGADAGPNIPWTPLWPGGTIDLTTQDMMDLLGAITSRRNTLTSTLNAKRAAIAGLTSIGSVIAYDVTAGW